MDWIGWAVVLVVVAVVVGLVLERRRRRARLGGPEHSGAHLRPEADPGTAAHGQVPPDHRLGGYLGGSP